MVPLRDGEMGGCDADKLVERGLVDDPLDVFALELEPLGKLNLGTDEEPRIFGEKNARKLLDAAERAKSLPLARWLHALAIPEVGETTAHDLAKYHESLEAVAGSALLRDVLELDRLHVEMHANNPRADHNKARTALEKTALANRHAPLKEQANIVGRRLIESGFGAPAKKKDATDADAVTVVGPVIARATLAWFASERGREVLARLRALGIAPRGKVHGSASNHPFSGKTLVLTGTLTAITRGAATERIRAVGGNVSSSVSGKTDFLVVGENAGSKLDEARKHGVKELSEAEFLEMIGGESG